MNHAQRAQELFYAGYNCAQAVFCAFAEDMGLDLDAAARLSSSSAAAWAACGSSVGPWPGRSWPWGCSGAIPTCRTRP